MVIIKFLRRYWSQISAVIAGALATLAVDGCAAVPFFIF